ncbi:MAG TPA: adenylate/guanylate cyclase domain-containing protein [Actinomycetota bacterium]|nr:adenylate/guanylate cyclase domain-containing protein [Actinomycetota bacterium]
MPHIRDLPTGTVTFLFTDVEGSTRLLQELGDRWPAVRDEHAAILRQAIEAAGGVEVSTEGDSFFAAFASPVAAVTGEGVLGGDDYVGIDVHRAARVAGAAAGGQVLVSGATRAWSPATCPRGRPCATSGSTGSGTSTSPCTCTTW